MMGGNGMGAMMPAMMGMMGVMSLVEAYRIYGLRGEQRLHTHPLFRTARSWNDRSGRFDRINTWDLDDPVERQGAEPLCCMYAAQRALWAPPRVPAAGTRGWAHHEAPRRPPARRR